MSRAKTLREALSRYEDIVDGRELDSEEQEEALRTLSDALEELEWYEEAYDTMSKQQAMGELWKPAEEIEELSEDDDAELTRITFECAKSDEDRSDW